MQGNTTNLLLPVCVSKLIIVNLQVEGDGQEVVEGKVEEARGELGDADHQVEKVVEVGGAGEKEKEEKERRVSIEIIEDANNILIEESEEEEDLKGEDSENIEP